MDESQIVLLDVMVENMQPFLEEKGWNVKTVTVELGATQKDRDDTKILEYAGTNDYTIVTDDKRFAKRLKELDMKVIIVEPTDKAHIISEKLESEFDQA